MIEIDGCTGEGGGQVLRSALSLSMITQTPFRIFKIRGNRSKPGLLRQHLTAVKAAAEICGAEVLGAELNSGELEFRPKERKEGRFRFDIGTAGSTGLVLQTILWPLAMSGGGTVEIRGGTHVSSAPPFDFLSKSFCPAVALLGFPIKLTLHQHGFFPAGGGRLTAQIGAARPQVVDLAQAAFNGAASIKILWSRLGEKANRLAKALDAPREEVRSTGPGLAVLEEHPGTLFPLVLSAFVERERAGVLEQLAEERAKLVGPVDEYLADQLLIPMALAGGGEFISSVPSLHTTTNAEIIQLFLNISIVFQEEGHKRWRVRLARGEEIK
jgi:RNA 3'-terminal phosphate cyclase (ATP)